ncbi:hypothetical protein [Arthrobacter sp. HLT1-20]
MAGHFGYLSRAASSATKWSMVVVARTDALKLRPCSTTSTIISPGGCWPRIMSFFEGRDPYERTCSGQIFPANGNSKAAVQ